jgi:hypothetical protein
MYGCDTFHKRIALTFQGERLRPAAQPLQVYWQTSGPKSAPPQSRALTAELVGVRGIEPRGCVHGGSTAHSVSLAVYTPKSPWKTRGKQKAPRAFAGGARVSSTFVALAHTFGGRCRATVIMPREGDVCADHRVHDTDATLAGQVSWLRGPTFQGERLRPAAQPVRVYGRGVGRSPLHHRVRCCATCRPELRSRLLPCNHE